MEEIEVKILEVDKMEVIERLRGLGARKIFDGDVITTYFDFEDRRLAKEGKILRLRKKGDQVELTYKKEISKAKAKIMEEYEIIVDRMDAVVKILEMLGLKEFHKSIKHRISYTKNNIHFEIDTYPDIPAFLEVEAPNLEKLKEYVNKLGFSMNEAKPWSIKDVLEYYRVGA